MSDLKDKADQWQSKLLKGIVLFAVIGCVVLILAIFSLGKVFADLTSAISGSDQPATQTQTQTQTQPNH